MFEYVLGVARFGVKSLCLKLIQSSLSTGISACLASFPLMPTLVAIRALWLLHDFFDYSIDECFTTFLLPVVTSDTALIGCLFSSETCNSLLFLNIELLLGFCEGVAVPVVPPS